MTLGDRIRLRREELRMSQEELATRLGYKSRSTIAKIESGENDLTQSKIVAFAEALNTTARWLLDYDDSDTTLPPGTHRPQFKKSQCWDTLPPGNLLKISIKTRRIMI